MVYTTPYNPFMETLGMVCYCFNHITYNPIKKKMYNLQIVSYM